MSPGPTAHPCYPTAAGDPGPQLSNLQLKLAGSLMSAQILSPKEGGRRRWMSGWKVGTGAFGTQMVGSWYMREQSGRGRGEWVGLDLQSAGCGPGHHRRCVQGPESGATEVQGLGFRTRCQPLLGRGGLDQQRSLCSHSGSSLPQRPGQKVAEAWLMARPWDSC